MMTSDNLLPIAAPFLALLLLVSGARAETTDMPEQWDAYVNDFIESYFAAHPDAAVRAGRHEFDGKLPDWSRAGHEREDARLRGERERALAFDPALLDEHRRFERDYVTAVIEEDCSADLQSGRTDRSF
jgi:hypothetical protein